MKNARAEEVTKKVVEIEALLVNIARHEGVPFADSLDVDHGDRGRGDNLETVRIELARRNGADEWGLWVIDQKGVPKRLSDASLFLREEFLLISGAFVKEFLHLVEQHPVRQEDALRNANDAIKQLRAFK